MTYSVPVPKSDWFSSLKNLLKSKPKRKPKKPKQKWSSITIIVGSFVCFYMAQIGFSQGTKTGLYILNKNLSNFDSIILYYSLPHTLELLLDPIICALSGVVYFLWLSQKKSLASNQIIIYTYWLMYLAKDCAFALSYCISQNAFVPWLGLIKLLLDLFLVTFVYEVSIILLKIPDDRDHDNE